MESSLLHRKVFEVDDATPLLLRQQVVRYYKKILSIGARKQRSLEDKGNSNNTDRNRSKRRNIQAAIKNTMKIGLPNKVYQPMQKEVILVTRNLMRKVLNKQP